MEHESEKHSSARALNFLIVARTIVTFSERETESLRRARRERSRRSLASPASPGLGSARVGASPAAGLPKRCLLFWLSPWLGPVHALGVRSRPRVRGRWLLVRVVS